MKTDFSGYFKFLLVWHNGKNSQIKINGHLDKAVFISYIVGDKIGTYSRCHSEERLQPDEESPEVKIALYLRVRRGGLTVAALWFGMTYRVRFSLSVTLLK